MNSFSLVFNYSIFNTFKISNKKIEETKCLELNKTHIKCFLFCISNSNLSDLKVVELFSLYTAELFGSVLSSVKHAVKVFRSETELKDQTSGINRFKRIYGERTVSLKYVEP